MPPKKRRQHLLQQCPNCGAAIAPADQFCSQCGQSTRDLQIPIKSLLADIVEDFLHFDGKSLQTLRTLIVKPGHLTKDFIEGKRIRYVAPLRLYLMISIVFFFVLALPGSNHKEISKPKDNAGFNFTFWGIQGSDLKSLQPHHVDSVMTAHAIERTKFNRYLLLQMIRLQAGGPQAFIQVLQKGISYMMFILMPFFAWCIFLFYRRTGRQYLGSLVFSIHYHSFVFLIFSIALALNKYDFLSWLPGVALCIFPVYLFFGLRTVYGGSFLRTSFTIFILGMLQIISFIFLFIVTVVLTVLAF